jgi:hypothetical protein
MAPKDEDQMSKYIIYLFLLGDREKLDSASKNKNKNL